jgi:hypothetical protein
MRAVVALEFLALLGVFLVLAGVTWRQDGER